MRAKSTSKVLTETGKYLYTLQDVAAETGRSPDLLRKLHREGILPDPIRDGRGWRLYTENQIKLIIEAFTDISPKDREMREKLQPVRDHWEDDYGEYKESRG